MADQMQPTPRSTILGLFSDIVNFPLQYMSAPERTQQMQGTAQFLYGTGIPQTLERASYGNSLFSGAGGLGGTTRMRPETAEALMNVAPALPAAGRLAARAVRATEGLPVGMSIKDVSPKIGINVNQGGSSFADKIISGEKKFETRESDSLRSYVGKRVGIIRTGEGKAKAIGDVTLGEPIVVSSPEEFAKLRDLHLVPEGSKFDIKEGGVKYLYPIENPVPYGVEKDVAKYGIVSRKILGEPDTLEKAIYPQQAALDLAQARAALPIEQGGLGLPANNTAADRAKAMGFDVEAYHSTNASDITKFDLGKSSRGEGTSVALTPENAQAYGNITYPLKVDQQKIFDPTNKDQLKELKNYVENLIQQQKPYDKDSLSFYPFTLKKVLENLANPETGAYYLENEIISKSLKDLGYSGSIGMESGQSQLKIFNPDQIRSRFAAFDPFRKDVATATAMGVALPDLLAQPVQQYPTPYETTPMYTDPFGNTIGSSIR